MLILALTFSEDKLFIRLEFVRGISTLKFCKKPDFENSFLRNGANLLITHDHIQYSGVILIERALVSVLTLQL